MVPVFFGEGDDYLLEKAERLVNELGFQKLLALTASLFGALTARQVHQVQLRQDYLLARLHPRTCLHLQTEHAVRTTARLVQFVFADRSVYLPFEKLLTYYIYYIYYIILYHFISFHFISLNESMDGWMNELYYRQSSSVRTSFWVSPFTMTPLTVSSMMTKFSSFVGDSKSSNNSLYISR